MALLRVARGPRSAGVFRALARLSEDSKLNRALKRSSCGEASGEGGSLKLLVYAALSY